MHRVALRRIEKGEGIRASGRWHRRRLKPTLRVRGNRQQSARDGKGSFNGSANGIEMKLERADSKEIEGALRPNRPSAFGEIADLKLSETTARLMHRENLSRAEAANFLECLLNPAVTDAQIAAALTSLAVKGETVDELAGMAEAIGDPPVPVRSRHKVFIDTAGSGAGAGKEFFVFDAAAVVISRGWL